MNFFEVPGIDDAATRRDFLLLNSVGKALDKLRATRYATAFKRSTNQDDYRWGMLHRVTFNHPLGAMFPEFNIPPAGGAFPAPLGPTLPGIPVDGGFETVDVANNAFLVDSPDAFIILGGASQRYVARARLTGKGFDAETALPGGQSGVPGDRFYVNLLEEWLTNDTHPLRQNRVELLFDSAQIETILPARR